MRKMNPQDRKRRKRRRMWKKAMSIAQLLIIIVLILYILVGRPGGEEHPRPNDASPVPTTATMQPTQIPLDPNAGEKVTPTPAPTEPGIAIPGWGSIKLPAGELTAPAALNNPEANDGWYYLTYELRLAETEEAIFTTGLIPPGMYCNEVTLNRTLEPGEYDAMMHVQPYRMDEAQTPTNNAQMNIKLIVE